MSSFPIFCFYSITFLFSSGNIFLRIVKCEEENLEFPSNFSIGASTAAYQIEGAWNSSDKSESVWDWFSHRQPSPIFDNSNGDIACDSFHAYKEDVQLLEDIGFNHYRFSISWTRILPEGFATKVSRDGIKYYNDLLDELHSKGIQPYVTLYHWDHPEVLERFGGWTNELMVEWFADYARVIFRELGSKIKFFITINEPSSICRFGYGLPNVAPGKNMIGIADYICGHNILKAHAKAYHIYDEEFRHIQKGVIGLTLHCLHGFAKNSNDTLEDEGFQFNCGWFAHPIFSHDGDYPEVMKNVIAESSKLEGRPNSRLPSFSKEWIDYIRGTADYFGLNHYTSRMLERASINKMIPWYDMKVNTTIDPKWPLAKSQWIAVVPEGLRSLLKKVKEEYRNPPVYILENGYSDIGETEDNKRVEYLYLYLKEMLRAIYVDRCNVKAYTVWSLLDNFEWSRGYSERFGIIHVDFNDPKRKRTPKRSAKWFKNILKTRKLSPQ